jgi:hypothetical protein
MIYELVRNSQEQGTPISTKPVFNPMLGPSQSALINFGTDTRDFGCFIADILVLRQAQDILFA